jgi:hypothetical protein
MPSKKYYERDLIKNKIAVREYKRRLRIKVLDILGRKCSKCGYDDIRALQVDHVDGGGTKHAVTRTRNFGNIIIDSVSKNENKYQLLCANCNWIKRIENKECVQAKL